MVSAFATKYDKLLSSFAFKCKLRHYLQVVKDVGLEGGNADDAIGREVQVDRMKHPLKAPGSEHLKLKRDSMLSSSFFSISTCAATHWGRRVDRTHQGRVVQLNQTKPLINGKGTGATLVSAFVT
jgi:hypothetical protein